ncbi:MAG: ABC transporter substrate-binding protein [Proteobacteria bacterium]|nr:ABC transporter substrate-binding protein [Pseudomonadota bacterium]
MGFRIASIYLYLLLLVSGGDVLAEVPNATIPVLIPLTGSAAEQGFWIRDGVALAEEEFNKESKLQVKAVYEDTMADPKTAISTYQSAVGRNSFSAVITYGSGVAVALSPLTNRDKIVQMGVATATPAYRSLSDYTFRNFPSAEIDSKFVVDAILETLNCQEISIISIQNEYGVASAKSVKDLFEKRGGRVLSSEEIAANGSDYRTTLLKLREKNPKVVYLAVYPIEGATLLKQAKEMGIKSQFVAGSAIIGSKEFLNIAKSGAEGLIVNTQEPAFLNEKNSLGQRFMKLYREKYQEEPNVQHLYAARAYDAFTLLAKGYEQCLGSEEVDCLKSYLYGVKNYLGASGKISFDENGDIATNFVLEKIINGKFVELRNN